MRHVLSRVPGLPNSERDAINVLLDAGEWEVALETLCTQVFEHDLEIENAVRVDLMLLGEQVNVAVAYLLGDPWAEPPDKA